MSLLDKLPKFPFLTRKKEHAIYYFGLNIEPGTLTGSVWGIEGNKMRVVNTAKSPFKDSTDLIDAANFVLDNALADFEHDPTKILFGVPDDWLQDDDLKPDHLKFLKKMCRELDVIPMAYVSTTHAICHLLQFQTGAPVTSVLVGIGDPLSVSVVKAGKVIASKSQKHSGNLPQDIEKALLSFPDVEVLPSKIIIFGGDNISKIKEELQTFNWMAQLPFLHVPKIDHLEKEVVTRAVSFAGASEINPNINLNQSNLDTIEISRTQSAVHQMHHNEPHPKEDLGFVAGDIGEVAKPIDKMQDETGGVIDESRDLDVYGGKSPIHQEAQTRTPTSNSPFHDAGLALAPLGVLGGGFKKWTMLLIPLLVLVVLIGGFIYLQKAKVTVFVDLKTLEKDATIVADPAITAVDEASKKIPGKIVEIDESGSDKAPATGTKKIGDPGKGAVVVYNKTAGPKTFSTGTTLTTQDNLVFTLSSSVTVASQSAVEGGISFGKATVNAVASDIGPEGNLPAGKELTIKGFSSSDYTAKVDTAFTGGVSKNVTVVTADDQKKLLAQVSSNLRSKAQTDLQGKATGDMKILPEALNEKITSQSFSKKVGDQATDFTLNLAAHYKGTSYNDTDLKMIVSKLVQTSDANGYDIDLSQSQTQADVSKLDPNGTLTFLAKFSAKLTPKMDQEQLKKQIAGKSVNQAADILKTIESVIGSSIEIKPAFLAPLKRLPFLAKNITIEVTAK